MLLNNLMSYFDLYVLPQMSPTFLYYQCFLHLFAASACCLQNILFTHCHFQKVCSHFAHAYLLDMYLNIHYCLSDVMELHTNMQASSHVYLLDMYFNIHYFLFDVMELHTNKHASSQVSTHMTGCPLYLTRAVFIKAGTPSEIHVHFISFEAVQLL